MANRTDPNASALTASGTDPQNLMEYITRQKIYDSRYWKEECFGLSVADVLKKAAKQLECLGGLPTRFLSLTLKLLQLHPETNVMVETFIEQESFKYVRALGCLYIRLTARPVDVYNTLEPLYRDRSKLRQYVAPRWTLLHMDEFIHDLLTATFVCGIALPRLPARRTLQAAGYLSEGPRISALNDALLDHGGDPIQYLEYKALVEKSSAAMQVWQERQQKLGLVKTKAKKDRPRDSASEEPHQENKYSSIEEPDPTEQTISSDRDYYDDDGKGINRNNQQGHNRSQGLFKQGDTIEMTTEESYSKSKAEISSSSKKSSKKKASKMARTYNNLFKSTKKAQDPADITASVQAANAAEDAPRSDGMAVDDENNERPASEAYWNQEREKLGLKPLRK